jgi:hypothetical protein
MPEKDPTRARSEELRRAAKVVKAVDVAIAEVLAETGAAIDAALTDPALVEAPDVLPTVLNVPQED